MLRASKDGTKLEVTSVNNEHNHEISEVTRRYQYWKQFDYIYIYIECMHNAIIKIL